MKAYRAFCQHCKFFEQTYSDLDSAFHDAVDHMSRHKHNAHIEDRST